MKRMSWSSLGRGCVAVVALGLCVRFGMTQDPSQIPDYATLNLKAGYEPDPAVVNVLAGGDIKSKTGGFEHFIVSRPSVRLNYTTGKWILTIYAQSEENTTLLVRLPDGTWIANDDGVGAGHNPVLKFLTPQSGQYDIWVGSLDGTKTPRATLFVTELKK